VANGLVNSQISCYCYIAQACCPSNWPQAERDGLQKRLLATQKQHNDASSKAATAVQQVDAAGRDQKRLASEVERLSSVVHSHSVRLQK
jgi:hypothetical protein